MLVEEAAGGVFEAAVLQLLARQHAQARIVAGSAPGSASRSAAGRRGPGTPPMTTSSSAAGRAAARPPVLCGRCAASAASSRSTSAKTCSQSRGVFCRNSRALGYQGLSVRSAQPAPVRMVHQHHPDRPAEGSGQVGHRAVGHQHEVEPLDQRRGVGEIVEQRAGVDDQRIGAQRLQLVEPRPFLQADRAARPGWRQAQIGGEAGRAVGVVGEGDAARPDDADLEPVAWPLASSASNFLPAPAGGAR